MQSGTIHLNTITIYSMPLSVFCELPQHRLTMHISGLLALDEGLGFLLMHTPTFIISCLVCLCISSCGPRFETEDLTAVDLYLQQVTKVHDNALLMEKDDANSPKKRLKYMLDAMDDIKDWPDQYKEGSFKEYIMQSPEMIKTCNLMAKNLSAMVETGGITEQGQEKILREHYLLKLSTNQ